MWCHELTRWVHYEFHAHMHPGLCTEKIWNDYFDACAVVHPYHPAKPGWDDPIVEWDDA